MPLRTWAILGCLVIGIVVAHVFMWRSERMAVEAKLLFTVINAVGWTVVLGPIYLVHRWMRAVEESQGER